MDKKKIKRIILFFLGITLTEAIVLTVMETRKKQSEFFIAATTSILGDIVKNVVDNRRKVQIIIPDSTDPHSYQVKISDQGKVDNADLVISNGLNLEGSLHNALQGVKKSKPDKVCFVSDNPAVTIITDEKGNKDPHFLLSIDRAIKTVEYIKKMIEARDPTNAMIYRANAEAYIKKLKKLKNYSDQEIKKIPKEKRVIVMPHNAFGYWGKEYGFKIKPLKGLSTVAESSLQTREKIGKFIKQREIKAVFLEVATNSKGIEAIKQDCYKDGYELTCYTLYTDTLRKQNYIKTMKYNIATITKALM